MAVLSLYILTYPMRHVTITIQTSNEVSSWCSLWSFSLYPQLMSMVGITFSLQLIFIFDEKCKDYDMKRFQKWVDCEIFYIFLL